MESNTVIIPARKITDYLRLKALGYVTLWSGEGMICLRATEAVANTLPNLSRHALGVNLASEATS